MGGTAKVNGVDYTCKGCYAEVLRMNPDDGDTWFYLGTSTDAEEVVRINGVDRTKMACYVEAVRKDPESCLYWDLLALAMTRCKAIWLRIHEVGLLREVPASSPTLLPSRGKPLALP